MRNDTRFLKLCPDCRAVVEKPMWSDGFGWWACPHCRAEFYVPEAPVIEVDAEGNIVEEYPDGYVP